MSIEEDAIYPPEAAHAASESDDLEEARGVVNGLLCSLALWAVMLVSVCAAIALILPGKAG